MTLASASQYDVYAVEYNQSTNRFGSINLLNGNFTKISSVGSMVVNDIAYCPTNGMLYGISNTTSLITFNTTNGAISTVAKLSVSGIQSLAFRYSDGALFGATQSKLYRINPTNGTATLVGNYGNPANLGSSGQNIRFAIDGNLYVSNTSSNTDIYQINTTSGAATWMGEAGGVPYLMLQNASSNMYGVYIKLGTSSNAIPKLANLDLSSFVAGGTNGNGSVHQITVNLVGPGTNFPANFNFSGNVPVAVTNLTVPVSATGPTNQTAVAGSTVVFSTIASGTGPYTYLWSVSGQTNSSLTLNNVTTANAGTYSVIVGGAMGTVTNSATLTVTKATGSITLGNLNPTYNGSAEAATATTTPSGLVVTFTYNGSAAAPVNAGSYAVVATINDANYQGSVTNTMVIAQASSSITLGSLSQNYNGSAKTATATTVPSGLTVSFTYNGSATAPVNAGSYTVVGTISDANYQGSATNTMVIAKASSSITLGSLSQTYTGSAETATATTVPSGLAVSFTYNGSTTAPISAGSYTVVGTINDPNYQGSATNTMVIAQASSSITLGSLSQNYDGSAKTVTATTVPSALAVSFTYNGSATVPINAGSYTVVGTINDANYQGSATNTLVISAAALTVTNLVALDKTYDGSTNATLNATNAGLTGVLSGDDVTLVSSNAVASFADKTVNTNKPVAVTGLALGGAAAANYSFVTPTNLTADINAAGLTVSGIMAVSKPYDATTNVQLNGTAILNGVVSGDDVSLVTGGVSAGFAGPNAGTGLSVAMSGYTITGADAGNYTLAQPSGLTADITRAMLTITAAANTKTYDGTTDASAIPTVSGLQGFDTVNSLTEGYDTRNAGSGKTLSVLSYVVNDGNSGSNYVVSTVANTAGVILPTMLTVTVDNKIKFRGQPNPTLTASYNGFVGSENPGVLSSPVVLNTTATTTSGAGNYSITAGGAVAANYTVSYVNGTLQVLSAPQLTGAAVTVSGTKQFIVSWPTVTGQTYQIEYSDNLKTGVWTPLGSALAGNGLAAAVTNNMSASPQRFFRLKVQ
jgi:hypothetical protein